MTEPNKYVVTVNFLGTLTRGDIVTAKDLPASPQDLLAEKSIRPAKAEEAKSGSTWVEEPVAPADPAPSIVSTTTTASSKPKRPSSSGKKKPATPKPAPAPVVAPAAPVVESVDAPGPPPGD